MTNIQIESTSGHRAFAQRARLTWFAAIALLLSGCATTRLSATGTPPGKICSTDHSQVPTTIFWTTYWRPDQKEPALREAAALHGMETFASGQPCLTTSRIQRLPLTSLLSEQEMLALTASLAPESRRSIIIVVRELGPMVRLGFPVLVAGGTEVMMELLVLDAPGKKAVFHTRVHWEHGGPFYLRDTANLDKDMSAALCAAFNVQETIGCSSSRKTSVTWSMESNPVRWFRPGEPALIQ
ncbi:hypothetical protein [Deinococcus navajonensis]|uniref:Uncharacterized protein n=1 Tax=Deinococcus navajonensis TaxID=309884 RepID=A0ABV8XH14_9DEIO